MVRTISKFAIAVVLFACAVSAGRVEAQTPITVTVTITDPNGLPYSNANVQAQLVPTGGTPTIIVNGIPTQIQGQQNATTDVNGSVTMNLFCNAAGNGCSVITAGGAQNTRWQITVQETGVLPPIGTGPQTFSVTINLSGASGLAQNLSSTFNAAALALSHGAGGSGTVSAGTLGQATCYNATGTTVAGCPDITDRTTTHGFVFSTGLNGQLSQTLRADGTIGASVPVKLDPACVIPGGCVIAAAITDATGIIGMSADDEAATAGQNVRVVMSGPVGATPDNACSAGNFIINSITVTGQVHCATSPGASQILGVANTATSAGTLFGIIFFAYDPAAGSAADYLADPNTIYVAPSCGIALNCFQVNGNSKYISDPTFTNGNGNIVCPNNDCNFVNAPAPLGDINKNCWGTNATTDVSAISSTAILLRGVIDTVTDASHAHCTVNATATTVASGFFAWGSMDTPLDGAGGTDQIAAASAAAAGACEPLMFRNGVYMIERTGDIGNIGPSNGFCSQNSAVNTRKGFAVRGGGSTNVVILISPNTKGTNCTGPNATSVACYLGLPNMYASGMQFNCLGNSSMDASFNNKSFIELTGIAINGGSNFKLNDMIIEGCGGQNTGTIGLDIGHGIANSISGGMLSDMIVEAMGQTTTSFNPGVAVSVVSASNFWSVVAGLSGTTFNQVTGTWSDHGGLYGFTSSTTNNAMVIQGGTFIGDGTMLPYQTGAGVAEFQCGTAGSAANCLLTNAQITNPTTNGFGLTTGGTSTSTIHATGSKFSSPTASRALLINSPDKFFDDCGNSIGSSTINGTVFGNCSVIGTAPASSNIALGAGFGTGPTAGSFLGSDLKHFTFTLTVGSGAQTQATSTVTYTFPTTGSAAFLVAPGSCHAQQIGGTNAQLTFQTTTLPTATSVVFTPTAVATASATIILSVDCQ